jgi:hypothetical protein
MSSLSILTSTLQLIPAELLKLAKYPDLVHCGDAGPLIDHLDSKVTDYVIHLVARMDAWTILKSSCPIQRIKCNAIDRKGPE